MKSVLVCISDRSNDPIYLLSCFYYINFLILIVSYRRRYVTKYCLKKVVYSKEVSSKTYQILEILGPDPLDENF